jgi:hypothetical protein
MTVPLRRVSGRVCSLFAGYACLRSDVHLGELECIGLVFWMHRRVPNEGLFAHKQNSRVLGTFEGVDTF